MKTCQQICHGKHEDHFASHCDEHHPQQRTPKQQAFFQKFRDEGKAEERARVATQCYLTCVSVEGGIGPCAEAIAKKYSLKITQ